MCGIAGFLSTKFDKGHLKKMTDSLVHRGPDASGYFYNQEDHIGLGHRRLSILDLSEAANQPFFSKDRRYAMVYNGEVYNYKEIAAKYKINTTTTSDTEVIIEAFAKKGVGCFCELNGIFALAIWDLHLKKLTIARDHLGIKPLYYYLNGDQFCLASELKAITALIDDLSINKLVVPSFLHLGYIPHPFSIYNNVQKLAAGAYAEIQYMDSGSVFFRECYYWKIEESISTECLRNEETTKQKLNHLLTDAVSKQLVSDVPIGTFLSGGTDSSLVTALASKVSSAKINTFSIAVTDGKVNEAPYAAAVAKYLGTNHFELPITQKEMLELVPEFMNIYDEPFTDSSAFPTLLVSKLARQYVTVTLSGDGGDELFGGYGSYLWSNRLANPAVKFVSPLLYLSSRLFNNRYRRIGNYFQKYPVENFKSHVFSQSESLFSENELNKILVEPIFSFVQLNSNFNSKRKLNVFEQMSFWDIENYLKDDLLVKVDRASMYYSMETRVPILDYRVVEFALNLSSSLKITEKGCMKYLLKEVLYDYVPKNLLNRPKWGFSIPLSKWLKTDLKWMIDKYCSKLVIERTGIVQYKYVEKLKNHYLSGKCDYLYNRLWALIVLHWFMDEL